jgi:flagellar biogenesis protein FliO
LAALAAVIGLIFLARAMLRRLGGMKSLPAGKKGLVDVLEKKNLSPLHHLYLVRMGSRLLLGTGPEGVATLAEVTDPAEAAALLDGVGAAAGKAGSKPSQEGQT